LEQLPPELRLNPERLMLDLKNAGKEGAYLQDVDTIIKHLSKLVQGGDVICVFSNGGFGNIHARLLDVLGQK
jgi:UDP-N-acetylmuramate: L-alanyl-gamma-D-glutamyl-meso-diaminopimelate ligase